MRLRAAASIVLASLILVGTTSCNFISPQTTTEDYLPSEGYNFEFGEVLARNAILLSEDGDDCATLIVTFVNESGAPQRVRIQYDAPVAGGDDEQVAKSILVDEGITIFDSTEDQTIFFESVEDMEPGSLYPLYFQYGDEEGALVRIPVLDDTLEPYSGRLPEGAPVSAEDC